MPKFGTERLDMEEKTIFIDTDTISQEELLMEESMDDSIKE